MRIVIGEVDQTLFNRVIIGVKIMPKRGYLHPLITKTSFDFDSDKTSDRTGITQMNYDTNAKNTVALPAKTLRFEKVNDNHMQVNKQENNSSIGDGPSKGKKDQSSTTSATNSVSKVLSK
jgi:hypothetical protein